MTFQVSVIIQMFLGLYLFYFIFIFEKMLIGLMRVFFVAIPQVATVKNWHTAILPVRSYNQTIRLINSSVAAM